MQPMFNFQGSSAPVSAMLLLGTAALLVMLIVAAVVLLAQRNGSGARHLATVAASVAGAYLLLLLGTSLVSPAHVVEPGNAKYFCELDCHLAYSVVGSRALPAPGGARGGATFRVVTLKVWFDPSTTSARRGRSPLYPNPRAARLIDASGQAYAPSPPGQAALEAAEGRQVPLTEALRPGESYTTSLVFEVPASARAAELLLTESDPVTHLLIGHENSLLHHRVPFRLTDSARTARAEVHG